jgi:hypothetical protein
VAEERQELEARAKWCRRLAHDCLDEHVRHSLQNLAADLDRRAYGGQPGPRAEREGDSSQ